MDPNELRLILENNEIDPDKIDEIVASVEALADTTTPEGENDATEQILKLQVALDNETDWKKKAKLAARLCALNL